MPSGIVFEAFNHASGLKKKLLVILNDNKMSICPRVGGLADYLDRARMSSTYNDWNKRVKWLLPNIPLVGEHAERLFQQFKDAIKASLHHGMLFEELGFVYFGPIDGHDLKTLRSYLERVKAMEGPVLLHILTNKGHGFEPAVKDPVKFHAPAPFQKAGDGIIPLKTSSSRTYTDAVSDVLLGGLFARLQGRRDHRRDVRGEQAPADPRDLPRQFFDVGICESHAVAFAAGMAKTGARPVVDIYSTFLQRSYDQIFQEVALQDLPVVFCLDRAGLVGADGPTHHGSYDLAYLRVFPNLVVMAPGDEKDIGPMFDFALAHDSPVALRYPRANLDIIERDVQPVELGQAEILEWETDGMLAGLRGDGGHLPAGGRAAAQRSTACGSAWSTPGSSSRSTARRSARRSRSAGSSLTVEEGCLMGGFGSAVLEAANDAGLPTTHVRRLGLPDRYVMHAERDEQLAEVGLDVEGITRAALALARAVGMSIPELAKAKATNGPACLQRPRAGRAGRQARGQRLVTPTSSVTVVIR